MGEHAPEDHVPEHRADVSESHGLLSNGLYDKLKFVSLILLPAIAAAYFSFGELWELPNTDRVVGTIVIVDTFLGTLLGLSSAKHKRDPSRFDGAIEYRDIPGEAEPEVNLRLQVDPAELENKKEVTFKILPR